MSHTSRLIPVVAPIVLVSAITGVAFGPAAFANETQSAPVSNSASAANQKLAATMADRVYNLGGPAATGVGALINPSAMTVDAAGTVYYASPYSVGDNVGFRVMKIVNGAPQFTGFQSIWMPSYGTRQMSTLRIVVTPNRIYATSLMRDASTGKWYFDVLNSAGSGIRWPLANGDIQVGGATYGKVVGNGDNNSLVVAYDQQVRAIALNADGGYGTKYPIIAGAAGTAGFAGDGTTASATATRLSNPQGLAFDKNGNLLIADTGNNRVREITGLGTGKAWGKINTIAGNGNAGYSGDGQSATDAAFNAPTAVSSDAAGNIYIADTGNSKIRALDGYRVASTVIGSSQDPSAKLTPGVIAPNATLYNPSFVSALTNGTLVFSSGADSTTGSTAWQSSPLAGVAVNSDILPSWVGASPQSSGYLSPRGDASGRTNYSVRMPAALLPTMTPNADGTKWVTTDKITLMTQGQNGAPFTLTADAGGTDASKSNVSAEYWITNPITFSNVLLLHDVKVSYTDPSNGTTYSSMLPNGLSFAYVRGYNQSYVGQSPNTPMSWGDFSVPQLKDAEGNAYVPDGGSPVIAGDWIMNVGITLKPIYS